MRQFKHRSKMLDKQVAGLQRVSQKKKQEALLKVEKAIANLVENQHKITVRSVAKEAGVSVSYIYKYPELAYNIQKLREQQKYSCIERKESAKDIEKRLEILQQEKEKLAEELERLKNSIEQVNTGKKTVKYLQAENIKLIVENQKLKQELEYARQNLQQARKYILNQQHDNITTIETEAKQNIIEKISEE